MLRPIRDVCVMLTCQFEKYAATHFWLLFQALWLIARFLRFVQGADDHHDLRSAVIPHLTRKRCLMEALGQTHARFRKRSYKKGASRTSERARQITGRAASLTCKLKFAHFATKSLSWTSKIVFP